MGSAHVGKGPGILWETKGKTTRQTSQDSYPQSSVLAQAVPPRRRYFLVHHLSELTCVETLARPGCSTLFASSGCSNVYLSSILVSFASEHHNGIFKQKKQHGTESTV